MTSSRRLPWVWDYDLDAADFQALVDGRRTIAGLDRTWAVGRLLEYAPWPEIVRILGYRTLSGGTAASRVYLRHRYSDDLGFFTNDSSDFALWADRVIQNLRGYPSGVLEVQLRERRFVRSTLTEDDVVLKIEMVDDVPSRVGVPHRDPTLGLVDSAENILANKLKALVDRSEPKDLATCGASVAR